MTKQSPEYKKASAQKYYQTEQGHTKRLGYRHEQCAALKMEILNRYGGSPPRCSWCGITDAIVLCLDHMNGGGNEERKKRGYGERFWRWLKKEGFPGGYQVLCYNCNARHARGQKKQDIKNEYLLQG